MQSSKKAKNNKNGISLVTIALAFIPITGAFGIHDILNKRYKYGILHIFIMIVSRALHIFQIDTPILGGVTVTSFLFIVSYVWAIAEGIKIIYARKHKKPTVQDVKNKKKTKRQIDFAYDIKIYSITAFITAIIPILLWLFCLIVSGGSGSEDGPGAVWWLVISYYMAIWAPLAVISIIFGIFGIKTKLKALAIISLIIKIGTIIIVGCYLAAKGYYRIYELEKPLPVEKTYHLEINSLEK